MLIGLDAGVANGTNRVAVAVQAAASAVTFHRREVRPWPTVGRAAVYALLAAVVGALVAVRIRRRRWSGCSGWSSSRSRWW
ncbi:MAG: hypothetical protein H6705_18595 [Myxococcales bacterium]|nr:hypothetical protein [Myxococcales bacterium]